MLGQLEQLEHFYVFILSVDNLHQNFLGFLLKMQILSPIIFTEATRFIVPEFVYLPNPFFLVIPINDPIEMVSWAV